jgi:hypothetical protein
VFPPHLQRNAADVRPRPGDSRARPTPVFLVYFAASADVRLSQIPRTACRQPLRPPLTPGRYHTDRQPGEAAQYTARCPPLAAAAGPQSHRLQLTVIMPGPHLTSRLLPRAGSKVLIVAGLVVMGSGALLLTGVSVRSGYLTGFLPGLLVVGIGTGLTLPSAAVTAMSDIAEDRAGARLWPDDGRA